MILITNDDGINASGLWALYDAFLKIDTVSVIAPDRERSAVGHGITLHEPIRADRVEIPGSGSGYAVSGTPADCIKIGVLELLNEKPSLVVSGINPGANIGVNLNYSGTVAAAKEAALYGIPAMAVSISDAAPAFYPDIAGITRQLAEKMLANRLPFGTFLNINAPNLPAERIAGIRLSRQGLNFSKERIEKKHDPRNRPYYWQGCEIQSRFEDPTLDSEVLLENYISITPVKCDMTDYTIMENLKEWGLET